MLHVATVHWQSARWIEIQLRYLGRHLEEPFRVYAFLNEISEGEDTKFHYASHEPIREHAIKLNRLADVILRQAASDADRILFLDGDAFPIGALTPFLDRRLQAAPLAAVQRLENNGDRQPHPCFCATTVGFWRMIGGDWNEGHHWLNASRAPMSDVGGNLLGILERRGLPWHPLLRTNRHNLHPVWFGIYADRVYHHGAGFRRDKLSRADLQGLAEARRRRNALGRAVEGTLDHLLRRSPVAALRRWTAVERLNRRNTQLSEAIFTRIQRDEPFLRDFLE
ncbi:MAG TPA: hypothetical protein VGF85_00355 [Opitutaceae bacterium]|jgi:hypothetical protein